jgi:cytochrome P450
MSDLPVPGTEGLTRRCPYSVVEEYAKARDASGVAPLETPSGRPAWLLASFDETKAMLADPLFLSRVNEPPPLDGGEPVPGWFFGMDGAEHAQHRKLLTGQFTMRAARKAAPRIRAIVVDQLEQVSRKGSPVDLFEAFTWPVPARVICDLLGVPKDIEALLVEQTESISVDDPRADSSPMQVMWNALVELTAEKRRRPGDDMISELLATHDVSDKVAGSFALSLRLAGHAPLAHLVGLGMRYLLTEAADRPFGDPDRRDAAVEEMLRFMPSNSFGVVRVPSEDVAIRAETIREGQPVVASLVVANRDPARFEDAESFRPDLDRPSHLAFGYGPHQCLGHNFARIELGVIFEEVFKRFPDLRLAVPADEIPMEDSVQSYGVTALPVEW